MPLRVQQARPARPQPGWAVQAAVHEKWHAGERRSRHRHHPARPRQDARLPAKADAAAARGVDGVSAHLVTLFAVRYSPFALANQNTNPFCRADDGRSSPTNREVWRRAKSEQRKAPAPAAACTIEASHGYGSRTDPNRYSPAPSDAEAGLAEGARAHGRELSQPEDPGA